MKIKEIISVMENSKYISLSDWCGNEYGYNSGIIKLNHVKAQLEKKDVDKESVNWHDARPIELNEYLNLKNPFIL